jgi:hypothetical protein
MPISGQGEKTMEEDRKAERKRRGKKKTGVRLQEKAYGDDVTICLNAGCVLRKKAGCFGFEGCPGFKGK